VDIGAAAISVIDEPHRALIFGGPVLPLRGALSALGKVRSVALARSALSFPTTHCEL
jgi:hypothetical protein